MGACSIPFQEKPLAVIPPNKSFKQTALPPVSSGAQADIGTVTLLDLPLWPAGLKTALDFRPPARVCLDERVSSLSDRGELYSQDWNS